MFIPIIEWGGELFVWQTAFQVGSLPFFMITKEKLRLFAEQTNYLYIHRIGNYVVKVRFQEEGPSIDDKMEEYFSHLAEMHI